MALFAFKGEMKESRIQEGKNTDKGRDRTENRGGGATTRGKPSGPEGSRDDLERRMLGSGIGSWGADVETTLTNLLSTHWC